MYRKKSVTHPLQIYYYINYDSNLIKGLLYETGQCNYKIFLKGNNVQFGEEKNLNIYNERGFPIPYIKIYYIAIAIKV